MIGGFRSVRDRKPFFFLNSVKKFARLKYFYYLCTHKEKVKRFKTLTIITKDKIKEVIYDLCIDKDKVCDYNMTIMFTQNRDNNYMEQEFNSL